VAIGPVGDVVPSGEVGAPTERLRSAAMTGGPEWVRIWDWSSWEFGNWSSWKEWAAAGCGGPDRSEAWDWPAALGGAAVKNERDLALPFPVGASGDHLAR